MPLNLCRDMSKNSIKENIKNLKKNIDQICIDYGKNPEDIKIIGASKSKSANEISTALKCGINDFGENYLQEAQPKIQKLSDENIIWHFIGSIQKRKCREIALKFDWVHTVDRIEVAEKLNEHREALRSKLNICIQINLDEEETKSGINLSDLESFSDKLLSLENLRIRGLMALPKQTNSISKQKNSFSKLSNALNNLRSAFPQAKELSMGMSNDYLAAIAEGSTIIRIGTNIFGKRK